MKIYLAVLTLTFTVAASASGAIQYEFRQTSRSDAELTPFEVTGKATLDGDRSRIDYTKNPVYGDGSYVVSYLSSRTLYIVNPRNRTYYDVSLATVAGNLGSGKIEIANLKTNSKVLDDHPIIAGVPTDHHRLDTSYEMTVMFGQIPLRQSVQTTIDSWTTTAFGTVPDSVFTSNDLRTGNPSIDQLIEAESSKIKGLALRQVVTISTTSMRSSHARKDVKNLKLTKRQISEAVVTSVKTVKIEPSYFQLPEGYTKADPQRQGIDGQPIPASTPVPKGR